VSGVSRVGHELTDTFFKFAAARAHPNTLRCYAQDLRMFFASSGKDVVEVPPADQLACVSSQQCPRVGSGQTGKDIETGDTQVVIVSTSD